MIHVNPLAIIPYGVIHAERDDLADHRTNSGVDSRGSLLMGFLKSFPLDKVLRRFVHKRYGNEKSKCSAGYFTINNQIYFIH